MEELRSGCGADVEQRGAARSGVEELSTHFDAYNYIISGYIYIYIYIYMGNFRSTEQGENFKSSDTWLYLFKIMKKIQKPIFSAIYANVQKLF